jgi:hypothetical protein
VFAQVVEGGASLEKREEMDRLVHEELIPALRLEPGSRALAHVAEISSGSRRPISVWEVNARV